MKKILLFAAAVIISAACCRESHIPYAKEGTVDTSNFGRLYSDVINSGTNELHSLIVVKDGKIVYEQYAPGYGKDRLHILWSETKTFTATAVGFAIQDGLMGIDDKVADYFPDYLPENPSEWLLGMTVKDLMIMSSGFDTDELSGILSGYNKEPIRNALACGFKFEPGTRYEYNSVNSYLLGAIVSKVTGMDLADYVNIKLFKPLGISEYRWIKSAEGISVGGAGLYLSPESLAKMGLFYLQRGMWKGKRLLNEEWFDEATRPQIMQVVPAEGEELVPDDWNSGYCYQIWHGLNGSYRLDGARGQVDIVIPGKNAVIVVNSFTTDKRTQMKSIWENIYPSL